MTTYDDENLEPSEAPEPSLDELLGEVLGLIDQVVAAQLADGELARRRARIKAEVDRGAPTPPASGIGERKAGEDPTAWDGTEVRTTDKPLAYDSAEEHALQAGEQGGQPNLSLDPAVVGRRSDFGQGSTDDSPGTPSGL